MKCPYCQASPPRGGPAEPWCCLYAADRQHDREKIASLEHALEHERETSRRLRSALGRIALAVGQEERTWMMPQPETTGIGDQA